MEIITTNNINKILFFIKYGVNKKKMLLIIQNGHITPCLTNYLDEDYVIIKSFDVDVSKIDLAKYSIVIILGGHQSLTKIDQYPYLHSVVSLIRFCIKIEKPIFAICLGAQLVAYALGCEIRSSQKLNIGYDINILEHNNIFRSHVDYIVPNEDNKLVVHNIIENMPYLYYYDKFIIGIQCHPDLTPQCVIKYSDHLPSIEYATKNHQSLDNTNQSIICKILNILRKK